MTKSFLVFFLVLFSAGLAIGQSKKKKKSPSVKPPVEQPSALNPGDTERVYAPKASKKSSRGATYNAERDFYERMEDLEKTKRKNEKLAAKPQYSDPMYFGHKKPPKKRKPGKMRFCKECGIRH